MTESWIWSWFAFPPEALVMPIIDLSWDNEIHVTLHWTILTAVNLVQPSFKSISLQTKRWTNICKPHTTTNFIDFLNKSGWRTSRFEVNTTFNQPEPEHSLANGCNGCVWFGCPINTLNQSFTHNTKKVFKLHTHCNKMFKCESPVSSAKIQVIHNQDWNLRPSPWLCRSLSRAGSEILENQQLWSFEELSTWSNLNQDNNWCYECCCTSTDLLASFF